MANSAFHSDPQGSSPYRRRRVALAMAGRFPADRGAPVDDADAVLFQSRIRAASSHRRSIPFFSLGIAGRGRSPHATRPTLESLAVRVPLFRPGF
jgi:hypothetical protein